LVCWLPGWLVVTFVLPAGLGRRQLLTFTETIRQESDLSYSSCSEC
jgi:hypothetical protein